MGLLGEYRWRNLAEAFGLDRSGAAGKVHRAVAACPGESCDCHNMGPFLDGWVEGCGKPSECQEEGEAADKCGGAVGEGESRAEGEAEDGGGGECYRDCFFDFLDHFLVPDFVRRGSCISSFAGPRRACCGSLEIESIKIQKGRKNYFYFF